MVHCIALEQRTRAGVEALHAWRTHDALRPNELGRALFATVRARGRALGGVGAPAV